ncbi:hypothetical protein JXD38_12790 [candidate division WOR-3 bacterium]|nr:hypothetical protein [candidate division WOR-3 bacterium]
MRILVGTLYCGENELPECVASIERQTYRNFSHEVFSYLPDKAAHEALYGRFMSHADRFDLLVKVDADMVLVRDDFFQRVVDTFTAHPELKLLGTAVHDFFSDQLVQGLNAYRRGIEWAADGLFTDAVSFGDSEVLFDTDDLAPAAYHCPNPSDLQSFHYGVHRALKVVQPRCQVKRRIDAIGHWATLERIWANFLRRKDLRIGLAALGAELTFLGRFRVDDLNYSGPVLDRALRRYASFSVEKLISEVKRLRMLNFGWLPGRSRRDALRYLRGGDLLDRAALRELASGISWRTVAGTASIPWHVVARRIAPRRTSK